MTKHSSLIPLIRKSIPKFEANNCIKLSIFFLNKKRLIKDEEYGAITWSNRGGHEFKIGFFILLNSDYKNLCIFHADKDLACKVPLTITPCKFGGVRYWFCCPAEKDGNECKKRVGVLYKTPFSDYFACRSCHQLTYASSKLSGKDKKIGTYLAIPELREMENSIKRLSYKNRPTKKFTKFLYELSKTKAAISNKAEWMMKMVNKLDGEG